MQYALILGYRVFLHPLRKYPGPFLARLTDEYGGYHGLTKRLHLKTYNNHLKYGKGVAQIN